MTTRSPSIGCSDAASFVDQAARKSREHLHASNALGIEAVMDELGMVWEECREAGWDGFGAEPVSQETLRTAYSLLESLPPGFPPPSIGAEPDGDLTLEWHVTPARTLSVSVSAGRELNYSAILGPNRVYGVEAFFGDLPAPWNRRFRRFQGHYYYIESAVPRIQYSIVSLIWRVFSA